MTTEFTVHKAYPGFEKDTIKFEKGDVEITGDLTISGDLTANGDFTFGDLATDTFTVTGKLDCNGNVDLGSGDDTINIGSGGGDTVALAETITVATDKKIQLRDTGLYINSSVDGQLDIVADNLVAIAQQTSMTSSRLDVTTGYEEALLIDVTLDSTGSVGGVKTRGIVLDMTRDTATVANGDSRDQGIKLTIKDQVGGHAAGYFIRGFDIKAELEATGATISAVYGGNVTCEIDEGTATDAYVLRAGMKCDGVVTNDFIGIQVQTESQGTVSGDAIGLQFTTGGVAAASGAADHCIEVTQADSSGWTNLFHFTADDGTTCAKTAGKCDTDGQDSDAAIRVDLAGTPYYIPLFNAAHTTASW